MKKEHDYLKRLDPRFYQGQAYVHWSLTIEERKVGWLIPIFYYKFREILTHAAFRYGFSCPMYCCMPDHIHLLWIGILDGCDQRKAMRYFRRRLNPVLEKLAARFQKQPYDHVLREDERDQSAVEDVVEYIARNPERKGLVPADQYATYPYTGCLVPGCPEVMPFEDGFWERFWRVYSNARQHGLHVGVRDEPTG